MGFPIDLGGKPMGFSHRFGGKTLKRSHEIGPVIQWWQPLRQPGKMGFCLELQNTKIGGIIGCTWQKWRKNGKNLSWRRIFPWYSLDFINVCVLIPDFIGQHPEAQMVPPCHAQTLSVWLLLRQCRPVQLIWMVDNGWWPCQFPQASRTDQTKEATKPEEKKNIKWEKLVLLMHYFSSIDFPQLSPFSSKG